MQRAGKNHYATLGLDRDCAPSQIRAAYRALAKRHHPDLNSNSPASRRLTQELNLAHEILSDPELRAAHDDELDAPATFSTPARAATFQRHLSQDVHLRLEDFLRGTTREIRVNDPANPGGAEIYQLIVPPETAPGTRFQLPRAGPFAGGFVKLRVKASPNFRFKARGSDLRCDLKIKAERAAQGGVEMLRGISGALLRVQITKGVSRGEILRVPGAGLPRPRGGRGDLLVRICYRVEVRVRRAQK